jgi:hypothetical protein
MKDRMEATMMAFLEKLKKIAPYLKLKWVVPVTIIAVGGGFLGVKAPSLVKNMAKESLERHLAPLGIGQVEIEAIRFGWGRIYLQDIHTAGLSSEPSLSIQEMDIAISPFLKVRAIDVIGATFELTDKETTAFSKDAWQARIGQFGKAARYLQHLKIPTVAMHDCLFIVPTLQGPLKVPVHVVTETTVARNQVLTVDWGEYGGNKFYGQFILESGGQGVKVDVHAANIDIKMPSFEIKAPEISFWGTTTSEEDDGCKIDGFAKFDHLMLASYGTLKMPLELNFEGSGTEDDLALDALTISSPRSEANFLELEGAFKSAQHSVQMVLTSQIPQLSKLWDFTPLLATHGADKVFVEGSVNLAGEILWEEGRFKTSALALDMKRVSIIRDDFSIRRAAARLIFNGFTPLTTKGSQQFSAETLSIGGIDFKNVLFECLLDEKGLLQLNHFMGEALSGKVKAHQFQRVANTPQLSYQFEADFKNIELADILKLTDLSNLSGRAKLAGNASMRYGLKEGLDVVQAELHSTSDSGLIQYNPASSDGEVVVAGQKEVNMAFQVLSDLNFTVFNVRLEHAPNNPSEMQGIVKMLGSNPKVLNGYPFEFNIVTTGKLKDLVINTLQRMKPYTDLSELNKAIKATKEAKAAKKEAAQKSEEPRARKVIKAAKRAKLAKAAGYFKKKKRRLKDV